jgi:rSAM/selenodomain-associated transferase 1
VPVGLANRAGVCALAVMAKAPRSGEVKTRLVPPLRAEEAAILSSCFLQDITENFITVSKTVAVQGYVAYSPPGSEALFRDLVLPEILLLPPRRIGLGYSLLHAAEDLLYAGYGGACLVNADSPTLPTSFLVEAVEALRAPGDRVVLGPASDGGYYLIGLKYPHVRLFDDIAWSTERVLQQTVERAASLALDVVTLPTWYDVDDAASLSRLCEEVVAGRSAAEFIAAGYAAPRTAAYLRGLAASRGAEGLGIDGFAGERASR